jgi:hypothetical protein
VYGPANLRKQNCCISAQSTEFLRRGRPPGRQLWTHARARRLCRLGQGSDHDVVDVGPRQRQGTQLAGLRGAGLGISCRATSKIRSASRSPSARGTGSRLASRRSAASTVRWASMGSDLPLPRRCLRWAARTRLPAGRPRPAPRASPAPYPRVPSTETATRGPGATSAMAASNCANPPPSLPAWSCGLMSPSRVRADVGTGLGGVTGRRICDGSRQLRTGFWSGQHGGPGRSGNPGTGQKKGAHQRPDP